MLGGSTDLHRATFEPIHSWNLGPLTTGSAASSIQSFSFSVLCVILSQHNSMPFLADTKQDQFYFLCVTSCSEFVWVGIIWCTRMHKHCHSMIIVFLIINIFIVIHFSVLNWVIKYVQTKIFSSDSYNNNNTYLSPTFRSVVSKANFIMSFIITAYLGTLCLQWSSKTDYSIFKLIWSFC